MNNIKSTIIDIQGPCLQWCIIYNRTRYIIIGIIIGLLLVYLFNKYINKQNKKIKK
jgi:hypothetical protein